jgi:hypothetical protein
MWKRSLWLRFGQVNYAVPLSSINELVEIKPEVLPQGHYIVETAVSEEVAVAFVEWLELRLSIGGKKDFPKDHPDVFLKLAKEFWLSDLAWYCRAQLGAGAAGPDCTVADLSAGFVLDLQRSFTVVCARLDRLEAALASRQLSAAPKPPDAEQPRGPSST